MRDKMVKFCIGSNFADNTLYIVFNMGDMNVWSPVLSREHEIYPAYFIDLDELKILANNLLDKIKEIEEENK